MSTSDGISTEDWDVVHDLAVEVVNAHDSEKHEHRKQLLRFLERLEAKYGPLPSILATRADYLEGDDPAREQLFLRAHASAELQNDRPNLVYVAQSLAELYLERGDLRRADSWLMRMRDYLSGESNGDYSEYERLRAAFRKLAIRSTRD